MGQFYTTRHRKLLRIGGADQIRAMEGDGEYAWQHDR